MDNRQEEEYVFYRMASGDMLQAQYSLKQIARYRRDDPGRAFFQQAVLSYCRPFMECRGKCGKVHRLHESSFVRKELRRLHRELLGFRNQAFAHLDLAIRTPTLRACRTEKGCILAISFRGLRYDHLMDGEGDFMRLIDAVLERIYEHTKELETQWR